MSTAVDQTALDGAGERDGVADGPCLVVGYDRGESSRAAVDWAARALPASGTLVLVHACRPLHVPPSPFASASERRRLGRALIDELLLECDDAIVDVPMHPEVSDEDTVSALTSAALRHHGCPIVVGHSPHSRLRNAIGTVTSELRSRSPVPVVVIPSRGA